MHSSRPGVRAKWLLRVNWMQPAPKKQSMLSLILAACNVDNAAAALQNPHVVERKGEKIFATLRRRKH